MTKKLFLWLMLMVISLGSFAQDDYNFFQLGNSTSADYWNSPFAGWYAYNWAATLYEADEFEGLSSGDFLYGLAYHFGSQSYANGGTTTFYIAETNDDFINTSQTWADLKNSATQVYSNTINYAGNTDMWMFFEFDEGYQYNGGNIIIISESNGCTSSGGCSKYIYHSTADYPTQSFTFFKDYSTYSESQTLAELQAAIDNNNHHYKPDVRIYYSEGGDVACHSVTGLTVGAVTGETAEISWNAPDDGGYYLVQCKTANQSWDDDDIFTDYTSETYYSFTDLAPLTQYNIRVYNDCGSDISAQKLADFTTSCGTISTFPFSYGFESNDPCWQIENVVGTNNWSINSGEYNGGYSATQGNSFLFISFANGNASRAISPVLDITSLSQAALSFDFITAPYSGIIDTFGVYYRTSTDDSWHYIYSYSDNAGTNGWKSEIVALPEPSSTYQIAFLGDSYTANGWGVGLDNISVFDAELMCLNPTGLTASNISPTAATISWTGSEGATFSVEIKSGNNSWTVVATDITDNYYELSDLSPSSTYNVRVKQYCTNGGESDYSSCSFTTACAGITSIPQTWTFEAPNTGGSTSYPLPACWDRNSIYYPYTTSSYANNGSYSLYFYTSGNIGIMPPIDSDVLNINELQVSFYARTYNTPNCQMIVGVMTDPTNENTFTAVGTVNVNSTHELFEVPFADYDGDGTYIAFKSNSSTSIYVDDVTLEEIPSCSKPANLSANPSENSVELSWSSTGSTFNVYYKKVSESEYTAIEGIQDNTYTVTDLTASTTYSWYVVAVCEDGQNQQSSQTPTFSTLCGDISVTDEPYSENFDNYSLYEIPNCWTVLQSYTYSGNAIYPSVDKQYSSFATNNLLLNSGSSFTMIALPKFVEDLNTLRLQCNVYPHATNSGKIQIGILPSLATSDMENFEVLATLEASNTNLYPTATWTPFVIDFNNTETTSGFIAIKHIGVTSSEEWEIDDVIVKPIPACAEPTVLSATNIGGTSVDLTWNSTSDNVTLYYKTNNESEYTSVTASLDESGYYTLTELAPVTTYSWYVTNSCDDGNEATSVISSFTTACEELTTLPYSCDFENVQTAGVSYALPECWTRGTSSQTNPYVIDNSGNANNSNKFIYFYGNGSTAALPPIDNSVINLTQCQLRFSARHHNPAAELQIGVMTDPTDNSTFQLIQTVNVENITYNEYEVLLTSYTGTGKYVAIRSTSTNNIYVDDVYLELIPACPKVQNLTVTAVTENSATLTWNGVSENGYNVKYKATSATTWETTTTNTESITLNNLSATTTYEVQVAPVCDEDVPFVSVTFTTDAIPETLPYSTDFSTSDWTLNNGSCTNYWTIGTPSGETSNALFITNDGTTAGYSVGYGSTVTAEKLFSMPSTDSVNVQFDIKIGGEIGTNAYDYMKLFLSPSSVQYAASSDQNTQSSSSYSTYAADFSAYASQTGSASYPYIISKSSGNTISVNMNLANPIPGGNAKIVFLWRNDSSSGDQPGAVISNFSISESGEVAVVEPTVVTNAATSISQTAATLNGAITNEGNQTITARGFEWKATNGGTYAQVNASGNTMSYNLSGLTAGTSYTFRAFATTANTTTYGQEMTFTTLPAEVEPCDAPTNVTASDITDESVIISWTDNAGANQWNIQYRPVGGTFASATVNGTPSYTINDLQAATTYEVQVQAVCDEATSDWSTAITFTTTIGIEEHLINSISLYPNPASSHIDIRVSDNDVKVCRLEVYDVYGKLINNVEVIENPTRINVSTLSAGMYYVRVITDNGVATKNFVKK